MAVESRGGAPARLIPSDYEPMRDSGGAGWCLPRPWAIDAEGVALRIAAEGGRCERGAEAGSRAGQTQTCGASTKAFTTAVQAAARFLRL